MVIQPLIWDAHFASGTCILPGAEDGGISAQHYLAPKMALNG